MGNEGAGVPMYIENTQKKQRIGNTSFIHIFKIQIQVPYKYVRSIVCRRWADPTWAMWSSGSRGLGKHPVNYLRKSSLPKHLRLSCCGRHHQSSLAFSMHVWWWWCRWRQRHPWPRWSMSWCSAAGTSAARLIRSASSVQNGVVVVVGVGSRCRVGELDGVDEVS